MKSNNPQAGSADRKILHRLQAMIRPVKKKAYRLSAQVTGEEDWEVDEPQIRMSRAFIVMLVLHLVAVGGLFGFHVYGKDDREAEGLATRRAHAASAPVPAAVSAAPAPAAPAPVAVIPKAEIVPEDAVASAEAEGQGQHILQAGETKQLVAAKFGVTAGELEAANPGAAYERGVVLTIPVHERVIGAAAAAPTPLNRPLALIVATPSEEVTHRDFALKEGAENPYAPVVVEDAESAAPEESAAPRAALVKAEPAAAERPIRSAVPASARSTAPAAKPKPTPVSAAPVPVLAKPKPTTGSRTHVVQKGDTVYNVAKRYGLSPNEVMAANGITDPSRVQMGQVLKIAVKR